MTASELRRIGEWRQRPERLVAPADDANLVGNSVAPRHPRKHATKSARRGDRARPRGPR